MPPYYAKDREKLFNSIKSEQVKFPKYLSKEAVDLLCKLFIKDPEKRLGSGPNGVNDIKSHIFFSSINWESILEKKIKPPFIPLAPTDSYHAGESLNDGDNPFIGFSYDPSKEADKQNEPPQI